MVRAFHAREEFLSDCIEKRRRDHVAGIHECLVDVIDGFGEPEWRLCNAVWGLLTLGSFGQRCLAEIESDGLLSAADRAERAICNLRPRLLPRPILRRGMSDFKALARRHAEWHETLTAQARDLCDHVQIFANALHSVSLERRLRRRSTHSSRREISSSRLQSEPGSAHRPLLLH